MAVYTKEPLSGSPDGLPISVTGTASGDLTGVHTVGVTSTLGFDILHLWITGFGTDVGGAGSGLIASFLLTTAATTYVFTNVISDTTISQITPPRGLSLTATSTVLQAWGSSTATGHFIVHGHVDRITPT